MALQTGPELNLLEAEDDRFTVDDFFVLIPDGQKADLIDDSVTKKALYEAAGVTEYWLIDPRRRRAEFYRLVDGRYDVAPFEHNRIFRSEALPGCWLDVEWLSAQPLPGRLDCLQQIQAGEPAG